MNTIRLLRTLLFVNVGFPVLFAVLFELDILPSGTLTGMPQEEFLATIVMELVTLVAIPVALRLFKTKNVEQSVEQGDEAAFRKWSIMRILLVTEPLLINTLCYYLFMNTTFGYMALILLICIPFIYPASQK